MALLTPWFQTSGLRTVTREALLFELPHLWQFIMQCQETSTENFPYPAHTPLRLPFLRSVLFFTSDSCGFLSFKLSLVFLIFWLLTHIQHFSSFHLNSLSAPHCWPFGFWEPKGKWHFQTFPGWMCPLEPSEPPPRRNMLHCGRNGLELTVNTRLTEARWR